MFLCELWADLDCSREPKTSDRRYQKQGRLALISDSGSRTQSCNVVAIMIESIKTGLLKLNKNLWVIKHKSIEYNVWFSCLWHRMCIQTLLSIVDPTNPSLCRNRPRGQQMQTYIPTTPLVGFYLLHCAVTSSAKWNGEDEPQTSQLKWVFTGVWTLGF